MQNSKHKTRVKATFARSLGDTDTSVPSIKSNKKTIKKYKQKRDCVKQTVGYSNRGSLRQALFRMFIWRGLFRID